MQNIFLFSMKRKDVQAANKYYPIGYKQVAGANKLANLAS